MSGDGSCWRVPLTSASFGWWVVIPLDRVRMAVKCVEPYSTHARVHEEHFVACLCHRFVPASWTWRRKDD